MRKPSEVIVLIEQSRGEQEFLRTGFPKVDSALDGGFMRKELVVLGGRSGIGKSYLAAQLLYNIASQGFKTGYFSLEISNEMIVSRLLGAIANLKSTRVRTGLLTLLELEDLSKAKGKLSAYEDYLSFYDDVYTLDQVKKEIVTHGYEFLCVDFIQNVIAPGADEYTRLSHVALELQKLAKERNCCILILSQLSNMVSREGRDSSVVEYKGSGNIATVCDLGFFIHREMSEGIGIDKLQLALRKNRRGQSGIYFDLVFRHPGGWIYEQTQE